MALGVFVGSWRGLGVAVKTFYEVITNRCNPHNFTLFQREVLVCSRLHHPCIVTVCGAVMEEGLPFQLVMELLEGSVSEVITAAHASGSYLTRYEQLCVAMDITSAISYLHQIFPLPYVHGDIRPSNALVATDMKVKVGDLGAARIIESSLSVGPVSRQYLSPERIPRADGTGASSTLASDRYSLGVTLIEIFSGTSPIPEERNTQLAALADCSKLFLLCRQMIDQNPGSRPSAQNCYDCLKIEREDIPVSLSVKRLVRGMFEKDRHKVELVSV